KPAARTFSCAPSSGPSKNCAIRGGTGMPNRASRFDPAPFDPDAFGLALSGWFASMDMLDPSHVSRSPVSDRGVERCTGVRALPLVVLLAGCTHASMRVGVVIVGDRPAFQASVELGPAVTTERRSYQASSEYGVALDGGPVKPVVALNADVVQRL